MIELLMLTTLAITERLTTALGIIGLLSAALLTLIVIVIVVRKFSLNLENRLNLDGFSINELKQLLEQGKLTNEEFERAKASVIAHNRKVLKSDERSEK